MKQFTFIPSTSILICAVLNQSILITQAFSSATRLRAPFLSNLQINDLPNNVAFSTRLKSSSSTTTKQRFAQKLNWDFLDAVYVITCPNADVGRKRQAQTKEILDEVGMSTSLGRNKVLIREFLTDDEDRVRGCYTSHISIMQDAKRRIVDKKKNDEDCRILVLEDNLACRFDDNNHGSNVLRQDLLNACTEFLQSNQGTCDILHLAYTPYVPNLTVLKTNNSNIVQLKCGVGSALGTTAYIATRHAIDATLKEHSEMGYVAAIPDIMAKLFPDTRYASYPAPFQRAPKTKSLVNPQLDDLRSILFQPYVVALTQDLLVVTGLCTNNLLPVVVSGLFVVAGAAGKVTMDAGVELFTTGSYQGNVILPMLSSAFSFFSLGVLGVGAALAPKPEPDVEPAIAEEN